ncbi:hypothetical protein DSO57_1005779 [Entomophthora muscae]|uniref:Uncharacterized protein n=1 Tax=Entomophthora muscae TaxID=34485 RepID=A0ACC2SX99_9FUNG|nr:hypothetical protein DSO57_1005779 [Entomophthora muscae]
MFGYQPDEKASAVIVGVLVFVSALGIGINAFLLCVLDRLPEKSTSFVLILLIGVADLLLCVFTLLVCVSRLYLGFLGSYLSWFYCPVLGSLTFFFSSMSGILMGFLAIERYSVICHQQGLPRGIIWALFSMVALTFATLLTGNSLIGGFAPDPSFIFCMPRGTTWSMYADMAFNILLNIPIVVLTFCYISIFLKCYQSTFANRRESLTRKAALRSLLFLLLYFACYIPKFSTTVIGAYGGLDAPPRVLYMIIPVGMTMLALVNPILVLLLHRRFKDVIIGVIFSANPPKFLLK